MIAWPSEIPTLSWGDVRLRPTNPEDKEKIFRGCQDPYIPTVTRIPANYTMAHAAEFLQRDINGLRDKTELRFAIDFAGKINGRYAREVKPSSTPLSDEDMGSDVYRDISGYINIDGTYFVGLISLHSIDAANHHAEIGYWVVEPLRGFGITSIAARLITDWGLVTLGFRRIDGLANVENIASHKVMLNAGYEFEGTMKDLVTRGDKQIDMKLFAATADEWKGVEA